MHARFCPLYYEVKQRTTKSKFIFHSFQNSTSRSIWNGAARFGTVVNGEFKPRSYGLFFHEFCPRFALFPVVGRGRIDVARGLVSGSVVSRVMAANSSHIKGGGPARRRQCIRSLERCRRICQATRRGKVVTGRNSTDHSPQVRTLSDSRFCKATHVGTRLNKHTHHKGSDTKEQGVKLSIP
ncbi:hypothetical protein AVEN_94685-1 [Araneus ventricosus]|uniref:Uncharacterized protein n=1 Tax=Araneus ventricosus TaxID=182803 RepID=A0A4Y2I7J8_ARAVE|nr:hypothetical protein AVEN_94685-1 [Araneus ventricosus]